MGAKVNKESRKPKIFVGSSAESLDISYAVQENLEHDADVTVWTQSIFEPSKTSLDALLKELQKSDFGIFVFNADDLVIIRSEEKKTVRDNVVFELGLFIGRLGSARSFIFKPRDVGELYLPSDLLGLTPVDFPTNREDNNLVAALGPACNRVRKIIREFGSVTKNESEDDTTQAAPEYDENDIKGILTSWMKSRDYRLNSQVITFADVDKELGLEQGSTKKYIKQIASGMNYQVQHEGENTILFKSLPLQVKTLRRSKFIDWDKY